MSFVARVPRGYIQRDARGPYYYVVESSVDASKTTTQEEARRLIKRYRAWMAQNGFRLSIPTRSECTTIEYEPPKSAWERLDSL